MGARSSVLYRNALPVTFARHGALKLRTPLSFGFARHCEAVPLGLSEIAVAAQWYPIAFSAAEPHQPLAILGLVAGQNAFVDAAGHWREGAYVPAVIRRYPFGLGAFDEDEVLCVETVAEVLDAGEGGTPLFEGMKPSAATRTALRLCQAIKADEAAAHAFVAQLKAFDLLDGRTAMVELPSGEKASLSGFLTIDEGRFRRLEDEAFLTLRRRGWLTPIFAQIQSTLNWGRLADHLGGRAAA